MRCYRSALLLLAVGCGSTGPNDSHVPQVGRYDYQLDNLGQHLSADLVIYNANETSVSYRFFVPTVSTSTNTATYAAGWLLVANLGSRMSGNTMIREGNAYRCSAHVTSLAGTSTGTCSFTFEGPDSLRTSP